MTLPSRLMVQKPPLFLLVLALITVATYVWQHLYSDSEAEPNYASLTECWSIVFVHLFRYLLNYYQNSLCG